ncbi:MAG: Ig-like domain-containing protein [Anaerolineales bacterium]
MQKRRTLLIIFVVLALALASCSGPAQEPAESEPTGGEQEAAAEATATPVPETEDEEPTADTEEAEPTEEESQEVEEADTPEEEEESALAEVADVDALDSYRQTVTMRTREGDGEMEEMTYTIRAVREPPARHIVMSSTDEAEAQEFYEMIQIGSTQYIRTSSEEDSWMTVAGDEELAAEEAMGDLTLPSADEFMGDEGCEMVGTEKISGLETKYYRCDLGFMEDEELSFEEAKSDIWVSTKYNLPIKVQATYTGKGSDDEDITWETEQVIDMINESIEIQAPEGVSETGLPDDIPLMDSATRVSNMGNIVTFQTTETVEAVTEFYKEEMPKEGWTEDEEQGGTPGYFGFTKEDRVANLMVTSDDGSTEVTIMLE